MANPSTTKEPIIEAEESTLEEIYSTEPRPMKRRAGRELPEPTYFTRREEAAPTKDAPATDTPTAEVHTADAPTKDTPENAKSKTLGLGKRLLLAAKKTLRLGSSNLNLSEEGMKSDRVAEGS